MAGYESQLKKDYPANIQSGESFIYQKTRDDVEKIRFAMARDNKIPMMRKETERPVIPNRLAMVQLSAKGSHYVKAQSMVKLAPMIKNIQDTDGSQILTSGTMGYGTRDHKGLFKPSSLYELGTAGQLKSAKLNKLVNRENVKLAKENVTQSTGTAR